MFDFAYFLLINAAKPDLENYLKYLESYYKSLSQNLSAFGVDVASFYPFELLQEHWRVFAPIGKSVVYKKTKRCLWNIYFFRISHVPNNAASIFKRVKDPRL